MSEKPSQRNNKERRSASKEGIDGRRDPLTRYAYELFDKDPSSRGARKDVLDTVATYTALEGAATVAAMYSAPKGRWSRKEESAAMLLANPSGLRGNALGKLFDAAARETLEGFIAFFDEQARSVGHAYILQEDGTFEPSSELSEAQTRAAEVNMSFLPELAAIIDDGLVSTTPYDERRLREDLRRATFGDMVFPVRMVLERQFPEIANSTWKEVAELNTEDAREVYLAPLLKGDLFKKDAANIETVSGLTGQNFAGALAGVTAALHLANATWKAEQPVLALLAKDEGVPNPDERISREKKIGFDTYDGTLAASYEEGVRRWREARDLGAFVKGDASVEAVREQIAGILHAMFWAYKDLLMYKEALREAPATPASERLGGAEKAEEKPADAGHLMPGAVPAGKDEEWLFGKKEEEIIDAEFEDAKEAEPPPASRETAETAAAKPERGRVLSERQVALMNELSSAKRAGGEDLVRALFKGYADERMQEYVDAYAPGTGKEHYKNIVADAYARAWDEFRSDIEAIREAGPDAKTVTRAGNVIDYLDIFAKELPKGYALTEEEKREYALRQVHPRGVRYGDGTFVERVDRGSAKWFSSFLFGKRPRPMDMLRGYERRHRDALKGKLREARRMSRGR